MVEPPKEPPSELILAKDEVERAKAATMAAQKASEAAQVATQAALAEIGNLKPNLQHANLCFFFFTIFLCLFRQQLMLKNIRRQDYTLSNW